MLEPGKRVAKDAFGHRADKARAVPATIEAPSSEDELAALVRYAADAGLGLKCAGTSHARNDCGHTEGILVRLDRLAHIVEIDPTERLVTVEAGIELRDLNDELGRHGLALRTLGSIDKQSVASALATATHSGGPKFGNLPASIRRLRLVDGRGWIRDIDSQDPDLLRAARVGLDALGVVTRVTLECEPLLNLEEHAEPLAFDVALRRLPKLLDQNDFLRLRWLPHSDLIQVVAANHTGRARTPTTLARRFDEALLSRYLFAAAVRLGRSQPAAVPTLNRSLCRSLFRPLQRVDKAALVFHLPELPACRAIEYAVALEYGVAAMYALRDFVDHDRLQVNFIVEVCFAAEDDNMLSPAYGRPSCQIGAYVFESQNVERWFSGFEELMLPMGGRPHWGKEFSVRGATIREMYPEYDRFNTLRRELDPGGVFENDFVRRVFVG